MKDKKRNKKRKKTQIIKKERKHNW